MYLRFRDKYVWQGCEAVEFDPLKLSGLATVGSTRMNADGVHGNFDGLSVDEIVKSYGVDPVAVKKIFAFAAAKGFQEIL